MGADDAKKSAFKLIKNGQSLNNSFEKELEEMKINAHWVQARGAYRAQKQFLKKRFYAYDKNLTKAKRKVYQKLKDYKNQLQYKIKKEYSFLEYFERWFQENKEPYIKDSTKQDIFRARNLTEKIHNLPLSKITKPILVDLINTFPNNSTKDKATIYLKAVFKCAFEEGVLKNNPFATIVTQPRKIKKKPAFSFEEQEKILKALQNVEYKPIIIFYLILKHRLHFLIILIRFHHN